MKHNRIGDKPSLLLIEDQKESADPLTRLLSLCGFSVELATDAAAARAAFHARTFDYLLSDLSLPDGDGCDLVREMLECQPVIAVAVTGWHASDVEDRCKEAGFLALMIKPVDIRALLCVLHRVTGKRSPFRVRRMLADPVLHAHV